MSEQPIQLQNAAKGKPRSFKKCVEAFCKNCIYDPLAGGGTWRQQVGDCPAKDCALYPVRPLPAGMKR